MKKLLYLFIIAAASGLLFNATAQDLQAFKRGRSSSSKLRSTLVQGDKSAKDKSTSRKKHASDKPAYMVFEPYIPSNAFLRDNPDFLKDSTYRFNYENTEISSDQFPLRSLATPPAFNNDCIYIICYGDPAKSSWLEPPREYELDLRNDSKYYNKKYLAANPVYKTALERSLSVPNIKIQDIKAFRDPKISRNTVYLAITDIVALTPYFKKKDKMPSVICFQMYAINNLFDTIATYQQVLFAAHSNQEYEDGWRANCLAQALPGLLAQFYNDSVAQSKISRSIPYDQYDPGFITAKQALEQLRQIQNKESIIIDLLESDYDMKGQAEQLARDQQQQMTIDAIFAPFRPRTTTVTNADIIANGAGQMLNLGLGMLAKAAAEKKARNANRVINRYKALQQQEAQLFGELKNDSLLQHSELADKQFTRTELIAQIEKSISEGAASLKGQIATGTAYTDGKFKSQFAAMTSAISSAGSSGEAVGSGTASTAGGSDACQAEADKAWRNSQEYRAYQQNPTNANASDNKAKLIELTLQYCGSKLPASEVQALNKAAAQERNVARQLRSGTPHFSK